MSPIEKLRVVQIASGDLWAGAEAQVYGLSKALAARPDVELMIILLNEGELARRLRNSAIPVHVFDEQHLGALAIWWRMLRELRRFRPHVVHTHRRKENVLGSTAARLVGAQSVRTVHGASEYSVPWLALHKRAYALLDRTCGRLLQRRVVSVSRALSTKLGQSFGTARVAVIDNGIDAGEVQRRAEAPVPLMQHCDHPRIAFLARLVPVKRVDVFLAAAQRLHAGGLAAEFFIIGDGPELESCRRRIQGAGLEGRIHLLGFQENAAAWLARMDILMLTSDHEGLPMAVLEAMALKVPVVAHAVGALPEVLEHGRSGVLVHEQTPAAFAEAVTSLLALGPEARRQLAQRALERVRAVYSSAAKAGQYCELYKQVIARHGSRRPQALEGSE
jgi:L-malate glycosyltransferase